MLHVPVPTKVVLARVLFVEVPGDVPSPWIKYEYLPNTPSGYFCLPSYKPQMKIISTCVPRGMYVIKMTRLLNYILIEVQDDCNDLKYHYNMFCDNNVLIVDQ